MKNKDGKIDQDIKTTIPHKMDKSFSVASNFVLFYIAFLLIGEISGAVNIQCRRKCIYSTRCKRLDREAYHQCRNNVSVFPKSKCFTKLYLYKTESCKKCVGSCKDSTYDSSSISITSSVEPQKVQLPNLNITPCLQYCVGIGGCMRGEAEKLHKCLFNDGIHVQLECFLMDEMASASCRVCDVGCERQKAKQKYSFRKRNT